MIDVCFNDSVAGMLKMVKNEIKSEAVFPLWMFLNCGHIDCDDLVAQQVKVEVEYDQYFSKNITAKDLEEEFNQQLKQEQMKLEKFKKFVDGGQSIRLWVSNIASDRCGLYWLCDFLKDCTNELLVVVCPGYEYDYMTNKLKEIRNWAMFNNPYFMAEFVDKALIIYEEEKIAYSKRWKALVEENAQLRILVDDMIVGVNEDFFDNAILDFVSAEPKSQNRIMGNVLRKWQSGDVYFISKRIERLIEKGKIKVCEDKVARNGCYWARTIALA